MSEFKSWEPSSNVSDIKPTVWDYKIMLAKSVVIVDDAIKKMIDNKGE